MMFNGYISTCRFYIVAFKGHFPPFSGSWILSTCQMRIQHQWWPDWQLWRHPYRRRRGRIFPKVVFRWGVWWGSKACPGPCITGRLCQVATLGGCAIGRYCRETLPGKKTVGDCAVRIVYDVSLRDDCNCKCKLVVVTCTAFFSWNYSKRKVWCFALRNISLLTSHRCLPAFTYWKPSGCHTTRKAWRRGAMDLSWMDFHEFIYDVSQGNMEIHQFKEFRFSLYMVEMT